MFSAVWLGVFACVVPDARSSTISRAGGTPTNTWMVVNPTPNTLWEPADFFGDCSRKALLSNPPGRAYSGAVIGDGRIYFFGGGHNSYPGNDMVVYDIAANQWLPDPTQPQCLYPGCAVSHTGGTPGDSNGFTSDNFPQFCTWCADTQGTNFNYCSGQHSLRCASDADCGAVGPCVLSGAIYNPNQCSSGATLPWDAKCLWGSCNIRNAGHTKSAFRCAGGSRDQLLCAIDADCTGGACSRGIPSLPNWTTPCPDCRPYTNHTYQLTAYNPERHKWMYVQTDGTWEYDFTTRSFTGLTKPPLMGGAPGLLFWDNPRSRMLFLSNANYGAYGFDYTANAWTFVDTYPTTVYGELHGTWDARANKLIVWSDRQRWFLYDPAITGAAAWTDITPTAPADLTHSCALNPLAYPCFTTSVAYDAANQRTIAMTLETGNVMQLWAYDSLANAWQKLPTSGSSGATNYDTGYPNNLHYDSGTSSLYFIDGARSWQFGPGGHVRTLKITLDLGSLPPPDTTPPTVPANLSATAVSSAQITLAWTASTDPVVPGQTTTGVQGYRIYRCQGAGCTPSAQPALSPVTSYQDGGLQASTVYTYAVAAYDAAGNVSAPSASASATTPGPGQPANPPPNTPPPGVASDLSSVRVYPNPWRSDQAQASPIVFDQFSGNATLKIFTVSGRLVKTLTTSSGQLTWDLTNDTGSHVASGLYIYLLTDDQGGRVRGKLTVIR